MRRATVSKGVAASVLLAAALWLSAAALGGCGSAPDTEDAGVEVLYLLSESYGVNYYLSSDRFDLMGWSVTSAALSDTAPACPPYADQLGVPPVATDVLVSDLGEGAEYDCLVLASSSAYVLEDPFRDLMADSVALDLVRAMAGRGAPVFAPCAGVRVLAAADLLDERRVVGTPKFASEFEEAGATFLGNDHPPISDGGIITGVRGMYYAAANAEAVAVALEEAGPRGQHARGEGRFAPSSELVATVGDTGVVWARTYGGPAADGARAVCATPDGGFLVVGYTFSHGTGDADMLIVKVDESGSPEWSHVTGGAGAEYGLACAAVEDGYLAAGFTTSFGAGGRDAYLVKLDDNGTESWAVTLGGESTDVASSVCASGGGYIVAGHTESFGAGESDVYLVKVDTEGRELWSKNYGGERFEVGNTVWPTGDGGLAVSASSGTYRGGNSDAYLVLVDSEGNEVRSNAYGTAGSFGHGFDWCESGAPTGDGGAVLVGYSDCQDLMDVYLARIDAAGEEMWNTAFGPTIFYDYGTGVLERASGGFAVCGATKSFNDSADNQLYVVETDANGSVLREIVFGGDGPEWGSDICETEDGFVVVGHTASYGAGGFDACLVKVGR